MIKKRRQQNLLTNALRCHAVHEMKKSGFESLILIKYEAMSRSVHFYSHSEHAFTALLVGLLAVAEPHEVTVATR